MSAGGVVYRRKGGDVRLMLIRDRFGRWSMPKGHIEPGESPEEAALREIAEETGLVGRVVDALPATRYFFRDGETLVEKVVQYFLVEAVGGVEQPQLEEISELRWFAPEEVSALDQYDNNRVILARAIELLGEPRGHGGEAAAGGGRGARDGE